MREWANKQLGRSLKIAGIFHLCAHEPQEPLSGQTALNAVSVAMWAENQALKADLNKGIPYSDSEFNTEWTPKKRNKPLVCDTIICFINCLTEQIVLPGQNWWQMITFIYSDPERSKPFLFHVLTIISSVLRLIISFDTFGFCLGFCNQCFLTIMQLT